VDAGAGGPRCLHVPDPDDLAKLLIIQGRNIRLQQATCLNLLAETDYAGARKVEEMDRVVDHLARTFEDRFFSALLDSDSSGEETRRDRSLLHVSRQLEDIGDRLVELARIREGNRIPALSPDILDLGQNSIKTFTAALEAYFQESIPLAREAFEMVLSLEDLCQDLLLGYLDDDARPIAGETGGEAAARVLEIQCIRGVLLAQLHIAESTIYRVSGERLNFSQYMHLERLAKEAGARTGCFSYKNLWGGISGAVVGKLDLGEKGQWVFKDGITKKILPEVENLKKWNEVLEGVVPRLVAVGGEDGETRSFLSEFVDGELLSDIVLNGTWEDKVEALLALHRTLKRIWEATLQEQPPEISYVKQIRDRLPSVFNQHPRLRMIRRSSSPAAPSVGELLDRAGDIEPTLVPPFAVMLHGDFNANNIMFNHKTGDVRFIDIHRSQHGDLVQDLGVFLVSGVRNPLARMTVLEDLKSLNKMTKRFARDFALAHGDTQFDQRLILSRARSFITSSRLISDFGFAKELFLEGLYYLDKFSERVKT
jgi:aminoglycoside phosphotransferase (APT) family kinase protein